MGNNQSFPFLSVNKNNGWPWNVEIPQFSPTMPDGSPWPKISIVTPSFNQAEFIEETIRSVICQGYPNLEYIIIDGGSSDGSVEIIKKYEEYITYWVSEQDCGQAHAINKGFEKSSGQIIAWINSDDYYLPDTFKNISQYFLTNNIHVLYGSVLCINKNSEKIGMIHSRPFPKDLRKYAYWRSWYIPQPASFFDDITLNSCGKLEEKYNYSFDYEWFLRLSQFVDLISTPETFACFRIHSNAKTGDWNTNKVFFYKENFDINKKFIKTKSADFWILLLDRLFIFPIEKLGLFRKLLSLIKKYCFSEN